MKCAGCADFRDRGLGHPPVARTEVGGTPVAVCTARLAGAGPVRTRADLMPVADGLDLLHPELDPLTVLDQLREPRELRVGQLPAEPTPAGLQRLLDLL